MTGAFNRRPRAKPWLNRSPRAANLTASACLALGIGSCPVLALDDFNLPKLENAIVVRAAGTENPKDKALSDVAAAYGEISAQLGMPAVCDIHSLCLDEQVVVRVADGDRIMFLKNERSLGVKNGSLGTVESVSALRMSVKLDDGKAVAFDLAQDIVAMRDKGLQPLASQRTALDKAGAELNALRPDSFGDLRKAVNRDLSLIPEAVKGKTDRAIQAMEQQAKLRIEAQRVAAANERRADSFVDQWQRQSAQYRALRKNGSAAASDKVRASLVGMAKGLERDPQLESVLANRRPQLGLDAMSKKTVSQDLRKSLGLSRGLGIGM